MPYRIIWVHEQGKNPSEGYLDLDHGQPMIVDSDYELTEATIGQVTIEALADMCDREAEDRSFMGAHRALALVLYRYLGGEDAMKAMWHIAERGGLDGMTGSRGMLSVFEEFGVPTPWKGWSVRA